CSSSFPDDAESQNFLPNQTLGKKKYEAEYVSLLKSHDLRSPPLFCNFNNGSSFFPPCRILLVAVSIFSLYSVHLLLKTANEGGEVNGCFHKRSSSGPQFFCDCADPALLFFFILFIYFFSSSPGSLVYENLGYKAFGHPGKLAASLSITMQNIGAMSSYLYIVKYELPTVIEAFLGTEKEAWYTNGDYLVLLVSLLIILPLSLLKNLGYLGYTSGFSLLCMVFFLIVVIYKKFQIACPLEIFNSTTNYFVYNSQTVYAIPILTFAFVCHPAILPMYEELKDRSRKKMQGVANVSFLGMFIMYLLAALFGYLTFYARVEPELLHTFSKVYQFDVVLLIVRLAVLTAVTLTVPVVLFPIRTSVNAVLWPNKEFNWIRHVMITVVLLVAVNILVIFVPTIRDIFGFIGASAAAMLIFILPSAFYIKLVIKEPMLSVQKIGATLFLISGFLVMIVCMSLIILDWVHQAMSPPSPGSGH
uniref:Sodium-coupled neutral amino acid symporter 2 n=1 Tax=Denticeps clupeoides TaxID=299321 RepID=A0AAY4D631_9TELE